MLIRTFYTHSSTCNINRVLIVKREDLCCGGDEAEEVMAEEIA